MFVNDREYLDHPEPRHRCTNCGARYYSERVSELCCAPLAGADAQDEETRQTGQGSTQDRSAASTRPPKAGAHDTL